ncbi:MAG: helix-turn-helix domain-containing protein [Acidobacteria bacterium]|nr:MAG: helix-turn-helix domain-containing protein [Acidobacteriota bacterium]
MSHTQGAAGVDSQRRSSSYGGGRRAALDPKLLGERIAQLRKERGLTVAELAKGVGIDAERMASIEKGERRPTSYELTRISEVLGRQVHELLAPSRARTEVTPSFRLARQVGLREARAAVDRVTALAAKFVELERILGINRPATSLESIEIYRASPHRPGLDPELAGEHAAAHIRNVLGVGNGPAVGLAERFEVEAGMRIFFIDDLPPSIAGLVIWGKDLGACIGINRRHSRGRRRWSLVHEVGHFLRDPEAGNILPTAGWHKHTDADAFAASFTRAFLMPKMSVSKQFADRCRANGGHFTVADILWMARLYAVTFQIMTEQLERFGFFPPGTYERLTRDKLRPEETGVRRAYVDRRKPSQFPMRYVTLALAAYERKLISEKELAEYLELDRFSVRGLYQQWCFQALDDGSEVELRLSDEVVTLI